MQTGHWRKNMIVDDLRGKQTWWYGKENRWTAAPVVFFCCSVRTVSSTLGKREGGLVFVESIAHDFL